MSRHGDAGPPSGFRGQDAPDLAHHSRAGSLQQQPSRPMPPPHLSDASLLARRDKPCSSTDSQTLTTPVPTLCVTYPIGALMCLSVIRHRFKMALCRLGIVQRRSCDA